MSRALAVLALLAVILVAPIVARVPTVRPAVADDGLTGAIAAAYFPRYADADLHAIAHERVAELAACECLNHDGMRSSTAEVVAFNGGVSDPIQHVVSQWQQSPLHNAILANTSYGRIGCAELVVGGTHWFACVLTWGELPPAPAVQSVQSAPQQGAALLPDTAMPSGE